MTGPASNFQAISVAGRARRICWRLVSLVLGALVLSGCATRVAYNQLDWIAVWYVDGYVDLHRPQELVLRDLVGRTLAWHRTTQLPAYAALLRALRDELDGPITPETLRGRYGEVEALFVDFRQHVVPDGARLLAMLSDGQVRELFANLEEENADLQEDYSGDTPADRRREQDRMILKNLRRVTGRLTSAQEALVRGHTIAMHELAPQWLERRRAWQRAFRSVLEHSRHDGDFGARLTVLVTDPDQFDGPGYRRLVEENQQIIFAMLADLRASLGPEQRRHVRERLDDLAQDFDILSRERSQSQ